MEHMEIVSFSSLVAGMLLQERRISSASIVNVISNLYNSDIYVEDEDDDLSNLFLCININANYTEFYLKEELDYSSILYDDITVWDYLVKQSNNVVFSYLGINASKKDDTIINDNNNFTGKKLFDIRPIMIKRRTKRKIFVQ